MPTQGCLLSPGPIPSSLFIIYVFALVWKSCEGETVSVLFTTELSMPGTRRCLMTTC